MFWCCRSPKAAARSERTLSEEDNRNMASIEAAGVVKAAAASTPTFYQAALVDTNDASFTGEDFTNMREFEGAR